MAQFTFFRANFHTALPSVSAVSHYGVANGEHIKSGNVKGLSANKKQGLFRAWAAPQGDEKYWHSAYGLSLLTSTVSRKFISSILKGQLSDERCVCWCPTMKFG
jgi:hypothetical protein